MQFSIIMPVYNREKCVANAIKSVAEQSCGDWELIVVNDGSTDNSLEISEAIAQEDNRITVLSKSNGGVSSARNAGLKIAMGDYVLFLDSDDILQQEALEELRRHILRNQCPDMICFGISGMAGGVWQPDQSLLGITLEKQDIQEKILPEHINVRPQTKMFLQPFVCNKCIKRAVIHENGLCFDESRKTWEDNIFLVSCLSRIQTMSFTDKILYFAGDSGENDHLSRLCNPGLLYDYIRSYSEYKNEYGARFEFDQPYTNTRYFTIVCDILRTLYKTLNKKEFNSVLDRILGDQTVIAWAEKAESGQ